MLLQIDALRALGTEVFMAAGAPAAVAASVTEALVRAEMDGMGSHGFSRIPFYADQALSGKVQADAEPILTQPAPGVVRVDAAYGFAFPAIQAGLEVLPLCARPRAWRCWG